MTGALRIAGMLALCVAGWIGPAGAQPIPTRLGNCTINDAVHKHMEMWHAEIEKRSNGRIKADMYSNCQLGTVPRQFEGLQLGTQDFFTVPPSFAAGVDPRYGVADAPGVFEDMAHAHRAVTHPIFYDKFMQVGRDKGMTPVSLWASGRADYLTLFPFRRHDDFKGKKIRVIATKLESEFIARHGATGVPIPFTEIVPGLVTKTIDGARTALLVMASAKMYTAAKNLTRIGDGTITVMAWFSNQYLAKLPSDLRDMIFQTGRDLQPLMLPIAIADEERGLQELKNNGIQIHTLPADEYRAWMERSRTVAEEVLGTNPVMKDLYAALKEAAAATRQ